MPLCAQYTMTQKVVTCRDNLPARLTAGLASRAAAGAVVGRRAPKAGSQVSTVQAPLCICPLEVQNSWHTLPYKAG